MTQPYFSALCSHMTARTSKRYTLDIYPLV
ncbi:hypothetical protein VPHD51_0098 [Vibrio phage D51]